MWKALRMLPFSWTADICVIPLVILHLTIRLGFNVITHSFLFRFLTLHPLPPDSSGNASFCDAQGLLGGRTESRRSVWCILENRIYIASLSPMDPRYRASSFQWCTWNLTLTSRAQHCRTCAVDWKDSGHSDVGCNRWRSDLATSQIVPTISTPYVPSDTPLYRGNFSNSSNSKWIASGRCADLFRGTSSCGLPTCVGELNSSIRFCMRAAGPRGPWRRDLSLQFAPSMCDHSCTSRSDLREHLNEQCG